MRTLLIALLGLTAALHAAEAKKADTRPNILFIIVDQQHAEMLSRAISRVRMGMH